MWIWKGRNPKGGKDWTLGAVALFTVEEALLQYRRKLRRAGLVLEAA
jgi:hypothetical protein